MSRIATFVLGIATLLALVPNGSAQAQADHKEDEQAIRELAAHRGPKIYAQGAIFVSGAYAHPIIGGDTTEKPIPEVQAEKRKNMDVTETIRRLKVSKAGDMAWEFTDFRASYDATSTGKHVEFPGSMLRVWQKVGGQWRVVAEFRRPNGEG
jgi:ketosteroid isomerase-like protein